MASLSLRGLSKTYDRRAAALRELSLEVEDGELVALLGPSGCGKSTILRLIAGLETPTTGTVWIGGREVTRLPPADRNVAMVFQSYALYPHFTVRGNLEFPLRMRGVNPADRITRVERVAAQLGLGDLLHRLPAQLSGGQRQRVALGRALVRNPDVFLLDEPLSNLDAALRAQLRAELLALHRSLGATMLYVTHDQVEALTLGHRLVLLKDGAIQQVGTPREVYDRPATTFVA
ncbi:MAG TPA: ABC transporter ATP-binding protein, partial [Gemmatimonadales bacterium]|nr:ABC transporter ATP-binding protein [Gemmatimonadales bacterium]